jgi:hypothetical protein
MRFVTTLFCVAVLAGSSVARGVTGRWQVVSMLAGGQARQDPELIGSIWTFDRPRLVVRDGKGQETAYSFTDDGRYLALTLPSGQTGWIKYELAGGGLRLAFFDDLQGKPASFEAAEGSEDPLLIVVRLVAR